MTKRAAATPATGKPRRRSKPRTFTKAAKETFLTHLATTAHVTRAAEAAGFTHFAAYGLRARDPEFAAAWRAALADGYDRIESALIRRALGLKDHPPVAGADTEPETGEIDLELAMWLLARHRKAVEQTVKEQKETAFRATRDGAEFTLLTRIRSYAKAAGVAAPFSKAEAANGERAGDASDGRA